SVMLPEKVESAPTAPMLSVWTWVLDCAKCPLIFPEPLSVPRLKIFAPLTSSCNPPLMTQAAELLAALAEKSRTLGPATVTIPAYAELLPPRRTALEL